MRGRVAGGFSPLALVPAMVGGLLLRWWMLASPIGGLDSDEAVGLMIAEDYLDGEITVFYWGQSYGGTLESILTAPVFAVTGPSVVAAKVVAVGLHALACLLIWRVGRRVFDERTGQMAGLLAWVLSPGVVWYSTKARAFYGVSIVLAMAAVLLAARLLTEDERDAPQWWLRRRGPASFDADAFDLLWLGLVIGLSVWVSPLISFVLVPVVALLAWQRRDLLGRIGWVVPGGLVGGAPWLAVNLARGFPSLEQPAVAEAGNYLDRLEGYLSRLLPTLMGLRAVYSGSWIGGPLGQMAAVLVGVVLVMTVWKARRRSWLPLTLLVGYSVLFAVPATTSFVDEPRYGYLLSPILALIVAWPLSKLPTPVALVPVALLVATSVGVVGLSRWAEEHPGHWDLNPPELDELEATLVELEIDAVKAEYWIAYRLDFETDLIASPTDHIRNPTLDAEVLASERIAWVWYHGSPQHLGQVASLTDEGVPFEARTVGPYEVITMVSP